MHTTQRSLVTLALTAAALVAASSASADEAAPSKAPSQTTINKPRDVRASVGEGGNDLTARFKIQGQGWLAPSLSLELRALAGPEVELAGKGVSSYRLAPEALVTLSPAPRVTLFAGGGIGSAYVVDTDARFHVVDDHVRVTASCVMGMNVVVARTPFTMALRTEGMSGAGWASSFNVGMVVPNASDK